jgi:hypothetical protein
VTWDDCSTECTSLIPNDDADYNDTQGICLSAFWALNATLFDNGKSTFLTDGICVHKILKVFIKREFDKVQYIFVRPTFVKWNSIRPPRRFYAMKKVTARQPKPVAMNAKRQPLFVI